ncbi:MAG TPA: ATP-binding protein [Acidimicrobiales bacterium]|nr:ATP-binding protein [Acidimicrobiales bacterium]
MARLVLHLPAVPASVTQSRHQLSDWLDGVGFDLGARTRDDLLVVVTELVTNGVLHDGGAPIAVCADADPGGVTVDVETADRCAGAPQFREATDVSETGRGLAIVGALSDAVTTEIGDGRRRVTCRLARRP